MNRSSHCSVPFLVKCRITRLEKHFVSLSIILGRWVDEAERIRESSFAPCKSFSEIMAGYHTRPDSPKCCSYERHRLDADKFPMFSGDSTWQGASFLSL